VADLKTKSLTNDGLGICVALAFNQDHYQEFCFPAETFVNFESIIVFFSHK
jgi:hypothetical protein